MATTLPDTDVEERELLNALGVLGECFPAIRDNIIHMHNTQALWQYLDILEKMESPEGSEEMKTLRQQHFDNLGQPEKALLETLYMDNGELSFTRVARAQTRPRGSSSSTSSSTSIEASESSSPQPSVSVPESSGARMSDSFKQMVLRRLEFVALQQMSIEKVLTRFDGFLDEARLLQAIEGSKFEIRDGHLFRID